MKKEWILVPAIGVSMVFCGIADAQGATRMRTPNIKPRINVGNRVASTPSRSARVAPMRSTVNSRQSSNRGPQNVSRSRSGHASSSRGSGLGGYGGGLGGFGGGLGNQRGYGDNPIAGLLGNYLNNGYGYGGGRGFDPFEGEKAHAKTYRDAAIANAIVNVVGILATTSQQRQGVVCAAPAPRGHVEHQRLLVQAGRTEEYRVWVPEYRIPETGELVVGHNETRRREIPPVYEEREVWVPTP